MRWTEGCSDRASCGRPAPDVAIRGAASDSSTAPNHLRSLSVSVPHRLAKLWERHAVFSENELRRRRYAEHPELRKKAQARRRAYYAAHKVEVLEQQRRKRQDGALNKSRRERYARDPEYRQKAIARNRLYRSAHKRQIAEQRRRKYRQDPSVCKKAHIRRLYGLSWDEHQRML